MALVSTLAADLGHTMLFGALANGRTLHLIDSDTAVDGHAFSTYMREHAVDALKIVPSHLAALLSDDNADVLPRRCLVLGGEACSADLLGRIETLAPDCKVANHYGPTETTVGVLTHTLAAGERQRRRWAGRCRTCTSMFWIRPLNWPRSVALASCTWVVPDWHVVTWGKRR